MAGLELNAEKSELEALLNSKEPAAVVDAILGSIPAGSIIARTPDGKVLRCSDFIARLLGRPRSEVEGRSFMSDELLHIPIYDASGRRLPVNQRPLVRALHGETVTGFECMVEAADGELVSFVGNASPIRNSRGDVIGAISCFTDLRVYKTLERNLRQALAQRENALTERGVLYRELTHRVKNHLQIMSAMVSLEARDPAGSATELAEHMNGQLQTLAAVYRGMDRAEVGTGVEARTFVEEVCRPYASDTVIVETKVTPPDLSLASDQAGPVGMLVNEAVANCRKHAFPNDRGHVHVSLSRREPGLRLEVTDDGVGWGAVDPSEAHHGLDLMRLFAKQLHSELELGVHRLGGAVVAADIPEAVTATP
jgi:two-component sensor histidine kinase